MREHCDPLAWVGFGELVDRSTDPYRESIGRLGAWDHVPALLLIHPLRDRMLLRDESPEGAAFPVAQVNLPERGFHLRCQTEPGRQRRGGLAVRRSVDT